MLLMASAAWRVRAGALVLVGALVVHEFAVRLAGRGRSREVPQVPGAGARWLGFAGLLLAIFAAQELAEMLAVHGRLELAESLIMHGGWLAGPLE